MENTELKGTVEKITYKNSSNGYTVFKLKVGKEQVTCVGLVPVINEGDTVTVSGNYSSHSIYGEQFTVSSVEVSAPKTQLQILKFLSSGAVKGVGPATALKIVERFKSKTLDIIENYPLELTVIKGISEEKALSICEEYKKQFGIRDIMISLAEFNITPTEATEIFKHLGIDSIALIRENPYLLCCDEIGFSFDRAEDISATLGLPQDNDGRICAGVEHILKRNLSNGHTCVPMSKLVPIAVDLLGVNRIMIEDSIDNMCTKMQTALRSIDGEDFLFLWDYFVAEEFIASKLNAYIDSNIPLFPITDAELSALEKTLGITFDEKQKESVNAALSNNVFILTGGPGTGKTTTLNALIRIFERRNLSISLCAPTGRAAKRITELTGYDAKTLHRLLEVEWGKGGKQSFSKNKKNPLDYDIIIIDEMSMVDTMLFKALLEACRITTRIILVGDSDQLPSVGAGNILGDLIDCGRISGIKLEKIFRQSDSGDIVKNAHKVISGQIPTIDNNSKDFFFLKNYNPELASRVTCELVSERLPNAYGFSSVEDIQVLCPSKKGACGSYNLNILLQEALNPYKKNTKELHYKGIAFREGDKVMQVKNDYDISWTADSGECGNGIFNGDIGTVLSVDVRNRSLAVRFDDKVATYFDEDLEILELGYAITVHKSQGSEFDCVVIPICDTSKLLRYRNLIYTAITRAKKMLVFVGNEEIMKEMILNDRKTLRYSGLKYFMENYDKKLL